VIEALEWNGENLKDISKFCKEGCYMEGTSSIGEQLVIVTLEGKHIATVGDFIIKGVNGEFYPCKPDIFEKTYEKV